jgi:hypothetical protein
MKRPVLVSTWGTPKKYFDAFMVTAKKHGLEPQNADPSDWGGDDYRTIEWFRKSEAQARFVREHADEFTHFMFTDSYDILFAAGWDEILEKYEKANSPILFGAECHPWPKTEQAGLYPPTPHRCKFLNGGFWLGTTEAALAMLVDIAATAALRLQCDQGIAVDLFLSRKHPIALDNLCSLLFCCNMGSMELLDFTGPRIKVVDTSEFPCIFHGNAAADISRIAHHIAP